MDYLNKLHKTELEILDFVTEICNANEIEYCLIYGSALGAYRHKGFIPWDDDIDIAMKRNDYEKFRKLMEQKNGKYVFQDMYSEDKYYMLFGKVRKKDTLFKESISEHVLQENGIYIDIFPLDSVFDSKNVFFKIKLLAINYLKHTVKFLNHKSLYKDKLSFIKYLISTILAIPTFLIGTRNVLLFTDRLIKSKSYNNSRFLAEYDETGNIQVIESSIYFPTKTLFFEGKGYNVPGKIEEYLKIAYGPSFMELPPIEQRHTHTPSEISFGDE